jgi:uncharacterized membrane protein
MAKRSIRLGRLDLDLVALIFFEDIHDGRTILAALFLIAGMLHFIVPQMYLRIVPPDLPQPLLLLYISGAAEMLGGLGLFIPATRRMAAWGLVALLIAVWPANFYMAMAHVRFGGIFGQNWAQWLRVPLQIPLIYWAWMYTRA